MKLTTEHIAPYLPYNVKAKFKEVNDKKCRKYVIGTIGALYNDATITCFDTVNSYPDRFKLILKPLIFAMSDPDFVDEFSEVEWERFRHCFFSEVRPLNYMDSLNYNQATILFKKHYDVFRLIENNLATECPLMGCR